MVTLPLVLLASSSTMTDGGVVRSCLLGGLHKLPHGLETVGCSNDMSSDSMEPRRKAGGKEIHVN